MQKIAIIDYDTQRVDILLLPKRLHDNKDGEVIEEWLSDKGYSLDNIVYMCGDIRFSEEMTNTELEKEDAELLASKKTGDELCNCGVYPDFHLIQDNCN